MGTILKVLAAVTIVGALAVGIVTCIRHKEENEY